MADGVTPRKLVVAFAAAEGEMQMQVFTFASLLPMFCGNWDWSVIREI